jgi:hypothetical protein
VWARSRALRPFWNASASPRTHAYDIQAPWWAAKTRGEWAPYTVASRPTRVIVNNGRGGDAVNYMIVPLTGDHAREPPPFSLDLKKSARTGGYKRKTKSFYPTVTSKLSGSA